MQVTHPFFEKPGMQKYWPGIAWFIFSAVLLLIPGSDLPDADDWLDAIYFDKWVHTGLFAVAAFLFAMPVLQGKFASNKKWKTVILVGLGLSAWGLTVEFLQKYYVPTRSYELADWGADSLGVALALLFIYFQLRKNYQGL